MNQCIKYPDDCSGKVIYDDIEDKWYCTKHFYTLEHLKETGRK